MLGYRILTALGQLKRLLNALEEAGHVACFAEALAALHLISAQDRVVRLIVVLCWFEGLLNSLQINLSLLHGLKFGVDRVFGQG